MRLTFVTSSLFGGGAERALSTMVNYWAEKGWSITILAMVDEKKPLYYDLHPKVIYNSIGIFNPSSVIRNPYHEIFRTSNFKRFLSLRRAISISRCQVVISFLDKINIATLIATRVLGIPVVVSERIDPAMYNIGRVWDLLRLWTYPWASRVVVQTEQAKQYFQPKIRRRIIVIPNPVLPVPEDKPASSKPLGHPCIVAMGRLDKQKGFDLLLRAFSIIRKSHPEWTLTILGEGQLRTELESLRDALGLGKYVDFPGWIKDPYKILKKADMFVLSSRFEGFPNALCEAMACGLPVISTDCPSGPREIIRNGVDGLLIPLEDINAMAEAMEKLIADTAQRKCMSKFAIEITRRFSLEKIMGLWEKMLYHVAAQ